MRELDERLRLGQLITNNLIDDRRGKSTQLANREVVHFCDWRDNAEQWIEEGNQAMKMTRLSCPRFRSNEVRLWPNVIAHNLDNL